MTAIWQMFFLLYSIRNVQLLVKLKLDITRRYCKPAILRVNLWDGLAYIPLSVSGFLNIVTRPLGGYVGDVVYRLYGTKGKKAWTILCGLIMGATFLAGGLYLQNVQRSGDASRMFLTTIEVYCLLIFFLVVPIFMGVFSVTSIFSELANGACFSLVPHYPRNVRCSLHLDVLNLMILTPFVCF